MPQSQIQKPVYSFASLLVFIFYIIGGAGLIAGAIMTFLSLGSGNLATGIAILITALVFLAMAAFGSLLIDMAQNSYMMLAYLRRLNSRTRRK